MRVAIVGAGAAGLTAAHLLDPHHDVVLFERQPIVGGHVRTLGGNVARPDLGSTRLDAGVIEFESINFPTVMRLFARLGLRPEPVPGDTTFIGDDGQILSEGALAEEGIEGVARFSGLAALLPSIALSQRSSHRTVEAYVLVDPDLPPVTDSWPDAPVVMVSDDEWLLTQARLRGWDLVERADLPAWLADS